MMCDCIDHCLACIGRIQEQFQCMVLMYYSAAVTLGCSCNITNVVTAPTQLQWNLKHQWEGQ